MRTYHSQAAMSEARALYVDGPLRNSRSDGISQCGASDTVLVWGVHESESHRSMRTALFHH